MFAGERLGKIRVALLDRFRELHVLGKGTLGPVGQEHLRFPEQPERRIDRFQRFLEEAIVRAAEIGAASGIPVSATGAAGLAGLLLSEGKPAVGEHVAVIFSGVTR